MDVQVKYAVIAVVIIVVLIALCLSGRSDEAPPPRGGLFRARNGIFANINGVMPNVV